ncbi:MAG TPA: hypothetical protein PKJ62_07370 [Bacteroidia bacterium]|nr:hypothetical protein [Bacteroidia bacterium]
MNDTELNVFDRLADEQRQQLTAIYEQRHNIVSACTTAFRDTITMCRANGWLAHETVWNSCLFVNLAYHDLSILTYDLSFEREEWKRLFIARSLSLLLYEIAEDISEIFGKKYHNALSTLSVSNELIDNLHTSIKPINSFRNEKSELLKRIRNVSAAHKDHDALTQLEVIENIDIFELISIGLKMAIYLNNIGKVTSRIIDQTSATKPPEI